MAVNNVNGKTNTYCAIEQLYNLFEKGQLVLQAAAFSFNFQSLAVHSLPSQCNYVQMCQTVVPVAEDCYIHIDCYTKLSHLIIICCSET